MPKSICSYPTLDCPTVDSHYRRHSLYMYIQYKYRAYMEQTGETPLTSGQLSQLTQRKAGLTSVGQANRIVGNKFLSRLTCLSRVSS